MIEFEHIKEQLQSSPTGDTSIIHAYRFKDSEGPSLYIQANLHGPEILGTPLLGRFISPMKISRSKSQRYVLGKLLVINKLIEIF